jgi:hypothetical protein
MQSTIEKGLYFIVLFSFIFFGVAASYAYRNNQALKHQQQAYHSQNLENQKIIVSAVKEYIACLLTIKPDTTSVHAQEQVCFDKAPQVK